MGHRWNDCNHVDPLSPFGHGLGYTTFRIEPTAVAGSPEEGVIVSVGVTNTGTRAGSELVQVYVEPTESAERRPVRALAALARITLAAGANGSISIELAPRSFSHWTPNGFVIPADLFSVLVGDSSRSLTTAGTVSRDRR